MASEVTQALTPNLSYEDAIRSEMDRTGLTRQQVLDAAANDQAESEAELAELLAADESTP